MKRLILVRQFSGEDTLYMPQTIQDLHIMQHLTDNNFVALKEPSLEKLRTLAALHNVEVEIL
jgi:hypothetical protein